MKRAALTVLIILIADQILKLFIKLNFEINEAVSLIPGAFELRFIENPGMAWGLQLPDPWGKIALTLFRMVAVGVIYIYLKRTVKEGQHKGFITCVAMILAGAIGNIIDSLCYGVLFTQSTARQVATWAFGDAQGYAPVFKGEVVDMLHITLHWPSWLNGIGLSGEIFPPIFNIADAAISIGVIWIIIRQRKYFRSKASDNEQDVKTESIEEVGQDEVINSAT
ncbi:MAG: lipoprotein signal peptidase [Bacteroidota bacterium]